MFTRTKFNRIHVSLWSAMQLVEYTHGDGIEVVLGGGRREFTGDPDPEDENISGDRQDGRDLIQEWLAKHPNSEYVWNKTAFDEIDVNKADHVMGESQRALGYKKKEPCVDHFEQVR